MGHSLIKIYNYNTTQALQRCDEFDSWSEIYMCNGELFMQNMAVYAEKKQGDFNNVDMYYPCNQINSTKNTESVTLCYRYQANYFLIQTNYDLQGSYSLYRGIKEQNYISICYKGIAAHLTKNNFNDLDKTYAMCMSTPIEYQEQCVIGATESLTRFVSEEKSQEFCHRLDAKLQETCHFRMNSLLDN